MASAQWAGGIALSVAVTACITVSNKDLLAKLGALRAAGPGMLLLMHRCVSYTSLQVSYLCSGEETKPANVPQHLILISSLLSNLSIFSSFFVLREASVTFHQLSRLTILPMGATVDYLAYGKKRTPLEYASILLISYGVAIGLRGEVAATAHAFAYAIICACFTLASSALVGHILKSTGASTRELLVRLTKYEIGAAAIITLAFQLGGSQPAAAPSSPAPTEAPFDASLLLPLALNCFLAAAVIYLTTWSQGVTSNMLYAVLGQAKMLATVALDALVFRHDLSDRTLTGLALAVTVAVGVALSDPKEPSDAELDEKQRTRATRRRWVAAALFGVALALTGRDAAVHGPANLARARGGAPAKGVGPALGSALPRRPARHNNVTHVPKPRRGAAHHNATHAAAKVSPKAVRTRHREDPERRRHDHLVAGTAPQHAYASSRRGGGASRLAAAKAPHGGSRSHARRLLDLSLGGW